MAETKYIHALAGLFTDPLMAEQLDRLVPSQWADPLRQAGPTAQKAAKLAAGVDQAPVKGDLKQPLQSVFASIQTQEGKAPAPVFWPMASLELKDDVVFPQPKIDPSDKPWTEFLMKAGELKALYESAPDDALPAFIENLSLLMQRHTWCLPGSYRETLPDVSLYDHSRMTAALASALAETPADGRLAQLVGGDLSGVQRFIYTITARGATSALRGRSFYLQLLTEACARYLLRELKLPATSLIYAGGGNFYFLAPANIDLQPLRKYISEVLLYHHRGDLYLAVDSVPLQETDFYKGQITNRWQELADRLNKAKLQTFVELVDGLADVFIPQGHGGNEDLQCQVCGLEHPGTVVVKRGSDDEGVRTCPTCSSYEDLGKDLRKARYLAFQQVKEGEFPDTREPAPGKWEDVLAHFGVKAKVDRDLPGLSGDANITLLALDDEGVSKIKPSVNRVAGRRFLVNVTPVVTDNDLDRLRAESFKDLPNQGDVKPYDVMEHQSRGIKRLGVMRMDVDNLSRIISGGFGDKASLSRLGALSFAISLFFEGWIDKLAEDTNEKDSAEGLGERLYSIYSGGDDLFFVGAWDAVIELARQIRADLGRYAGNHPGVHASAGVVLVGGKYPLYQAAQDAGQAEERAKDFVRYDDTGASWPKDAVTFLGQTLAWSQFGTQACKDENQQTVHAWAHRLEKALRPKDAPRALLGLLMNLQERYDVEAEKQRKQGADLNQERKPQTIWGPWNWLGVYYLKRMQKRSGAGFKDMLQEILDLLQDKQFASIQWIGLAARWAELKLRKKLSH